MPYTVKITALVFIILISFELRAETDLAQSMVNCIEAMDINRLSDNFASEMEISIDGDGGLVSSQAAKIKIDSFLAQKGVKSCSITHNGNRQNSGFCILSLKTDSGDTYRIYSYYKLDGCGKMTIQQFRIDYDG